MKKLLLCVLMLVCILGTFAGCDNKNKKYWEDTALKAEQIFGQENGVYVNENFETAYNITFCEELDSLVNYSFLFSDFKELSTMFGPLFESSISFAKDYYLDFKIVPKNKTKAFKKAVSKVNKNLDAFAGELQNFKVAKADYEFWVQKGMKLYPAAGYASLPEEKARLVLFKRHYISLIQSAQNLSESVFEARKLGYYSFGNYADPNFELVDPNADCMLAINASNLEINKCTIKIVAQYNANAAAVEYADFYQKATEFYVLIVKNFKDGLFNIPTDVKERLNVWMGAYDMFILEQDVFNDVLKKINIKELCKVGNNAAEYAKETGKKEDEIYANYYLQFHNNIDILRVAAANIFTM